MNPQEEIEKLRAENDRLRRLLIDRELREADRVLAEAARNVPARRERLRRAGVVL
jgi:hypothetical protein